VIVGKSSNATRVLAWALLTCLTFLGLSAASWGTANQTWIPLAPAADKAPRLDLLRSDFDQIVIQIQIPGVWSEALATEAGSFSLISLLDHGASTVAGEPNLPVMTRMVQIPFGAEVSVSLEDFQVTERSLQELGMADRIVPVQPSVPKIEGAWEEAGFVIDQEVYQRDTFLPEERVKLGETGVIRGHRYATVLIHPVSYNPRQQRIRIYSAMSIKVTLAGSDPVETEQQLHRYFSPPFEELCSQLFVNYPTYAPMAKGAPPLPMGYLIVTHQNFSFDLAPLVEWKTRKGFHVTVAEVPSIGSTKEQIKAYIEDAYDNWDIPPTYVMFVGDTEYIPTWSGSYSSGAPTDLYYVRMDLPPDYFADMFRGRLPAKNSPDANAMLNKMLYYENPTSPDLEWMGKACFIASSDASLTAERTHRYVIQNYLVPNGMDCDTIWQRLGGSTQDIADCVNDGASLLVYSGHGSTTGWGCVPFYQYDVMNLLNQDEYPFVCSHACLTGKFTVSECFGETWVKVPDKGGIAFWGASNLSYWGEDDILEKRMFQAAFQETCYSVGNMTDRALYLLYLHYGGGGMSKYYLDVYNVLGDPSLDVWTYPAESLFADFPSTINVGPNSVDVTVQNSGGLPVFGALVCLYKGAEVFETGYTDAAGQVTLYPNPLTQGQVEVTVSAHNFLPSEGSMEVGTKAGDVTGDGLVDLGDAIFLLNYLYKGGPAPDPLSLADLNCDGQVEMGDVVYLVNYLYKGGPPPCSP
jgi:hypothetical protein